MKWKRGKKSALVEDRRQGSGEPRSSADGRSSRGSRRRGAPGSGRPRQSTGKGKRNVLLTVAVVVLLLTFYCVRGLTGGGDGKDTKRRAERSGAATKTERRASLDDGTVVGDKELVQFVSFLIEDINDFWVERFKRELKTRYQPARLVLFEKSTKTACGRRRAASGPCYCPGDKKMYVPPSFYAELRQDLGASGDFAQALVMAHEMGHHAQLGMGVSAKVHAARKRDKEAGRQMLIRQELQADCLAGLWAHSAKQRDLLEKGDLDEAITALVSIGDDNMQRQAGARVDSSRWTHGSSAQRARWFKKGYRSGKLESCDTFKAKSL